MTRHQVRANTRDSDFLHGSGQLGKILQAAAKRGLIPAEINRQSTCTPHQPLLFHFLRKLSPPTGGKLSKRNAEKQGQVVVGGIERMAPGAPLSPNVLER